MNPCLKCDIHLSGGSKNNPECETCQGRINYIAGFGHNRVGSVPIRSTNCGRKLSNGSHQTHIFKNNFQQKYSKEDRIKYLASLGLISKKAKEIKSIMHCYKCGRKHYAKGMCKRCYQADYMKRRRRERREGDKK